MPFTPLHLGPGLIGKAISPSRVSLTMFGLTQVAIDLEPLIRMWRHDRVIHAHLHTLVGATTAGLAVMAVGRSLCTLLVRRWNREVLHYRAGWLLESEQPTWKASLAGVLLGAWSHVLLDSLMHYDIRPFAPFSKGNPLRDLLTFSQINGMCALLLVAGVAWWSLKAWRIRPRN